MGRTLLSTEQMRERCGGKGRCVELLHAFGDMLWALSPSRAAPNDGFSPDGVLPVDDGDPAAAEAGAAQNGAGSGAGPDGIAAEDAGAMRVSVFDSEVCGFWVVSK